MKINKELVEQYKQIILEVGLPPIEPPESEFNTPETSGDEYMMSMGPPWHTIRPRPGDILGPNFFGGPLSNHLPSWLRGVKNIHEAYQRYLERIPKQFRRLFSVRTIERFLLYGILPTDLLFVPVLVFDPATGQTIVKHIHFFRGADGKIRYLGDGGKIVDITDERRLWKEIDNYLGSEGQGLRLHPGYTQPNWDQWKPGDLPYDTYGPFIPPDSGTWPLHSPIGIGQNGQMAPGNGWEGWPEWLVPALIAPWLFSPFLQDQGGSVGQQPQSPATAPYYFS